MKKHKDAPVELSRRKFAISLATSLAVPTLAYTLTGAQQKRSNQETPERRPEDIHRAIPQEDAPINTKHEHIPPLMLFGGSFRLELPHTLRRQRPQSGPRPVNYVDESGGEYGAIYNIRILTEMKTRFVDNPGYIYYSSSGAELRLWLQRLRPDSDVFEPIDLNGDAQAAIKGGPPLVVEFNNGYHLGGAVGNSVPPDLTLKVYRRHRYLERAPGRPYRIAKWQVFASDGRPILDPFGNPIMGVGNESYTFTVSFYEPS